MKIKLIVALLLFNLVMSTSVLAEQSALNVNDINTKSNAKIETNNKFIYQGKIIKDDISSFEMMHETVAIPQDLLDSFEGKDIIDVGNIIRVEGIIKNQIRIAKEVELISLTQVQSNTDPSKGLTNTIKVFFSNLQNKF